MFKVQKKDGTIEDFDRNKVLNAVTGAGGSSEDAQKVLSDVEAWLPTVAKGGTVKSTEIRAKGLEVLNQVNPDVAKSFESFKKPE